MCVQLHSGETHVTDFGDGPFSIQVDILRFQVTVNHLRRQLNQLAALARMLTESCAGQRPHLTFMQVADTQSYLQSEVSAPTGPFQARSTVAV